MLFGLHEQQPKAHCPIDFHRRSCADVAICRLDVAVVDQRRRIRVTQAAAGRANAGATPRPSTATASGAQSATLREAHQWRAR